MRLLRQTGQNKFSLTPDLCNDEIPSYAILSHTWGADRDEVTFVDVQQGRGQNKAGYAKIQFCARQAKKDGIEHFWVDTCCINKDNHVELSEAITSMFQWYRKAKKCYVYLPDVSTRTSDGHGDTLSGWESNFRASRWFTRGWTLQELLAPTVVEFYSREEGFLGTKITLARQIHEITTIPLAALQGTPLSQFPIAERIRWTERRNTKKKEDEAYCLLGIFDVFMPLIYGEGDNALHRLQKEINGRFGADVTASLNASYKTRSLGLCLNSAPLIKPDDFVGRTTEINNVHNVLRPDQEPVEQRRAILGGIGGIGKTQLAIAYARRHQRSYTSVLWLNATSEQTLHASFRSIAPSMGKAEELARLDNEQLLFRIHEWLSQPHNTRWLLIFDNYDEPKQFNIDSFCPNTGYGSILITTRLPNLVIGQQVRLQPLQAIDDSLAILQVRSGRQDIKEDKGAHRLAERLAGFPLALITAGAYLRRSVITFQQYLDDYEQRWQVESRRPLQLQDYRDRTLYTTWNLSYNRLKEDDAEAAQMLQLLAYFDNQDVWFELLHAGMPDHPLSWLRGCLNELISFESVMSTLVDYCFVEVQYTTQSYSMHNCVHDWVLGELNAEVDSQLYWYAFDCVAASIDRDDWDLLELVKYARVSRHGVRLTHYRFEVCDKSDGGLFERLDAAEWTANMLNKQAQLLAAEQMYLRALAGKEKAFGSDHTSTLATVHNLGTLYRDQGKLNEAEQMLLRALAGTEKALGPDHTSTLATVHSLGTLYCDQGKLNEAEQMYLRALAGKEKALGPDHTSTLATVHGLGILYRDQGKLDEAEQMYLRALAGTEKALGPDHTSTLDTINNLGLLYRDQGKLNEAEQMFLRALDGYEKAYGREHQKPLKVRDILALIHKKIADQNTPKKQRSSRNWYRHVFRKLRDK